MIGILRSKYCDMVSMLRRATEAGDIPGVAAMACTRVKSLPLFLDFETAIYRSLS